jgi:hypothetical protein
MPVLLKMRLRLAFARLLLVCVRHLVKSSSDGRHSSSGDESGAGNTGVESTADRIATFARRNYSRAAAVCAGFAERLRVAREAGAAQAAIELDAVLSELGAQWHVLEEHVGQMKRGSTQPAVVAEGGSSPAPAWVAEVQKRSRVVLRSAEQGPVRRTSVPAPEVPSRAASRDTNTLDSPAVDVRPGPETTPGDSQSGSSRRSHVRQPGAASGPYAERMSHRSRGAVRTEAPEDTDRARSRTGDAGDFTAREAPPLRPEPSPRSAAEVDAGSPAFETLRLSASDGVHRGIAARSACFPAESWPELPPETAGPSTVSTGHTPDAWPLLPVDPVLDRAEPATARSFRGTRRQRTLEREQRGRPCNG